MYLRQIVIALHILFFLLAPSSNHRIVLNFTFMDTECTYDYLFVYDGDSYQSPLLASLSGNTLPQPMEAKSGKVSLRLTWEHAEVHT